MIKRVDMPKLRIWKEYHFSSQEDFHSLWSIWESSHDAYPGKQMYWEWWESDGRWSIHTNCTLRQMTTIARAAQVRLPRYERGIEPPFPVKIATPPRL